MRSANRKAWWLALALVLAILANRPALAGGPGDFRDWDAANDQEMTGMRGGFVTEGGLQFTFGIEKAVYVNGVLKASNTLNIANLGSGLPQLVPGEHQDSLFTLVQNGPGNTFFPVDPGKFPSGFHTVIQNSLDQQTITSIDRISTTINVLGLYRELGQAVLINQQLIHSLR